MIDRYEVTGSDDSKSIPLLQVSTNDLTQWAQALAPYGLHARPLDGGIAIGFAINGEPENLVAVPLVQNRPELAPGEVATGALDLGSYIRYTSAGVDIIVAGQVVATLTADGLTLTGKADISGDVLVAGSLGSSSAATGSFGTPGGQVVTVINGVIVSIS